MFNEATILAGSLFGAAILLGLWVVKLLNGDGDERRVRDRLTRQEMGGGSQLDLNRGRGGVAAKAQVRDWLSRVGSAAAKPFMPEEREKQSELRRRLSMAGIYTPSAIRVVTGFKFICLIGGAIGGYLFGALLTHNALLGLSLGGIAGYLAPRMWIKHQIKQQQRALEYGLPDALDLMVVCVEAGLAVDAAMERVGQELTIAHPRLSRELEITHMETRVGLSRGESLRNLGARTGCAALQSVASMLIQADRFGTSISGALKLHAEGLRVTRQQRAEELAAKASVKMSFPLVLFIFPATFIVLAGPTIVELLNSSLFN
jgi:tight adherence protein C